MKIFGNQYAAYLLFYMVSAALMRHNAVAQEDLLERFALDGRHNIMAEENFGIINGKITSRIHYRDVGTISGLFAPPYASSDFMVEPRLFGETVQTSGYRWYPFEVRRTGEINGISVQTVTQMIAGERAAILAFSLHNQTGKDTVMDVQFVINGGLDYVRKWEFARPRADKKATVAVTGNRLIASNESGAMVAGWDWPDMVWFEAGRRLTCEVALAAGQQVTYHFVLELGDSTITGRAVDNILSDPTLAIQKTREVYEWEVQSLFDKLPRFSAADKRLEDYYYRSLVTLLTNKWDVPEFILQPYYGSGGVIGGCVGNYLWEFGLPAQIFPLADPQAAASHIKQFLKVDMTKHYLFEPMTGQGGGVWYQVNQDKIVELIYCYVLHTRDLDFLDELVEGKRIYEHMLQNALFGDDLGKEVTLVDYGEDGENHLELRQGYPYQGVMPDVNALRYLTYFRAYQLTKLAGNPKEELLDRAETLKELLKAELWSEKDQWFFFRYGSGQQDIRWTNFMYTLIGTGVFDPDVELGLLAHLNEREFLGDYGIHSISKLDPAYDQADIDHGGGGSYMAFPPLICQRLYNAGYHDAADDLLERHLWWGERLPYWGDSKVANMMWYRDDTPLQSDFDSITGAQLIIFGLFGVHIDTDGRLTISPTLPAFSPAISLDGLKIGGYTVSIHAEGTRYTGSVNGTPFSETIGKKTIFN